jgi:putative transposase
MCQLAQVSRAGFYRYLDYRAPEEEDMTVRSAIQEIALEHGRYYGYRRVTAEARRRGMMVNHKRVARIMRTDNLMTIQNRELRRVPDREHGLEIYLNLAGRMTVRGPNQLWIADITYVRLKAEFVTNYIVSLWGSAVLKSSCTITVPKPYPIVISGLTSSEKQIPRNC